MNPEQIVFDLSAIPTGTGIVDDFISVNEVMFHLAALDLKRSIFSTSQNRVITYYFENEAIRDEAVKRWRKQGIEIIGYKEKPIMSVEDAIRETIDYFDARVTALQLEFRDNAERYREYPPDWAVKRQRELELEIKRLQDIITVFRADINAKVEAENEKAKAAP